ncbi:MAG: phosphotransferase [Dehalococcoidia bacterium]
MVEADPQAALRSYPLQAPVILGPVGGGIINDNWLVADGAGEAKYILRAYRRVNDASRIAFQLAFQEHLLASGFPTSAIIKTRTGESFACIDGLHWALFGFVAGEAFDFSSPGQAREAGRRLARHSSRLLPRTMPGQW